MPDAPLRYPHPGVLPQDELTVLARRPDAVVRVPEIPDRTFPGARSRGREPRGSPAAERHATEIDVPNRMGPLNP